MLPMVVDIRITWGLRKILMLSPASGCFDVTGTWCRDY